ncbi:unnamed protein product [Chironomus riparius]|uniref:Uncharacterized protein n=1 Tax=Chironomus riparius TaxID=315576 RepID=A0A9N9S3T6_9DIPT|nr:unnamed protein product [Chironomus riparius]
MSENDFIIYPFSIIVFIIFTIFICASVAHRRKRNYDRTRFSSPVVVTQPAHAVQFQAGPGNNFQPNPSAPYIQNMQYHMPMPPYQNNQQFQQPYQNVYSQQPPPYPGMPQQSTDNQPGFKIGVETFSSSGTTVNGINVEESRNTVTRY